MLHDLIVYTDIGDDIDDSLALWYLYKKNNIRTFIIVLYSDTYEKRVHSWSIIEPFFEKKPIIMHGGETKALNDFLINRNNNIPLDILCIGPATDFVHHLKEINTYQNNINTITYQSRMKYTNGIFIPDETSYNYKEDMSAGEIIAKLNKPIHRVGKYTAYQIGLYNTHFQKWIHTPIGQLLYKEGLHRRQVFEHINPTKCKEVYGNYPNTISFPYDVIAAIALYYPEFFQRVQQDNHTMCGHDIEHCFKVDKKVIYDEIDGIFR